MSNFIKSNSIIANSLDIKPIDIHLKKEAEIIVKQKETFIKKNKGQNILSKEEIANNLLEDAKEEAQRILSEALTRADNVSNDAFIEGFNKGYEDGTNKANKELQEKEIILQKNRENLERQYARLEQELEPRYVELVIDLIEKLTGVITEDYKDVLLYLIRTSINNMEKSKRYTIKLSPYDHPYVTKNRKSIESLFDQDVQIDIKAEQELENNQCIIETDNQVFDCSMNVQLENLSKSLKLVSMFD